eukprot:Opistho-2@41013
MASTVVRLLTLALAVSAVFVDACVTSPSRPWKGTACPELNCPDCAVKTTYTRHERRGGALAAAHRPGFASAEFALVIGIDGLGGEYLHPSRLPSNVSLPNFEVLKSTGTWTYHSRSVMPTISKPNWAGIIAGAGPEEHGVLDNDWVVGTELQPITGNKTYFPSIFQAIHDQSNGAFPQSVYSDWDGLFDLFPKTVVSDAVLLSDPDALVVTARIIDQVINKKAAKFVFLHFDDVDNAGHHFGWGSAEYYEAIMLVDACIGDLLLALERNGLRDKGLVVLTADHGGEDHSHGITDTLNIHTPLIISGPMVKQNNPLSCPLTGEECYAPGSRNIRNMDVSPTVLHALGFAQPDLWIGRPVEAF